MIKLPRKFLKTITAFLLLAIIAVPFLTKTVQAFTSGPNDTYPINFYNAVFETDEMNLQSFVYETMRAMIMSGVFLIVGDPREYEGTEECYFERINCLYQCRIENPDSDCPECKCLEDSGECVPESCSGGGTSMKMPSKSPLLQLAHFMGTIYENPPASGINYLADIGQRLKIVKPVYAQNEVGWNKFDYAMNIWRAFRNVAYVFFVLVLIFMGFAIMFRIKTSPQTVITIQSALPRIVLALILITFSYAIVGLLVDFMYVIINVIIQTFVLIDIPTYHWLDPLLKLIIPKEPTTSDFRLFMTMLTVGIGPVLLLLLVMIILGAIAIVSSPLIPISLPISAPWALMSGMIALIVAIVLLVALIRLVWTLLKAYVNVLIALIVAPFQLLVGALPGSKATGAWFKNLFANLAVWPTVFVMVFLAGYVALSGLTTTGGILGNMIFLPIVGIGILLLTPKAADMIKTALAGKPFDFGTALQESLKPPDWTMAYPRYRFGETMYKRKLKGPNWFRAIQRGLGQHAVREKWY